MLRGILLAGLLGLGGCSALLPDGITVQAREDEAPDSGPPAAALGFDAPPTVELRDVVAGVVGTGVLVENHSLEHLDNVEIVINPGSPNGEYRFRASSVPAEATKTYMSQVFRNAAGESLNPMATKVDTMAVYADTARGRGSWQGSYAEQY